MSQREPITNEDIEIAFLKGIKPRLECPVCKNDSFIEFGRTLNPKRIILMCTRCGTLKGKLS